MIACQKVFNCHHRLIDFYLKTIPQSWQFRIHWAICQSLVLEGQRNERVYGSRPIAFFNPDLQLTVTSHKIYRHPSIWMWRKRSITPEHIHSEPCPDRHWSGGGLEVLHRRSLQHPARLSSLPSPTLQHSFPKSHATTINITSNVASKII